MMVDNAPTEAFLFVRRGAGGRGVARGEQGFRGLGHEIFQVEWRKVGHILILLQSDALFCQGKHGTGKGSDALDEMGVGVLDG